MTAASLALCAVTLGAGTAFASSGVNLNGTFTTTETVLSLSGDLIGDTVGAQHFHTWTFFPTCSVGACSTTLSTNTGVQYPLVPSGSGFVGAVSGFLPCRSSNPPHVITAQQGSLETITARLAPAVTSLGAATQLVGTLTYQLQPTPAGRAAGCTTGAEVRRVVATAVAGTVRSALPPQHSQRSTIASSLVPISQAFPLNAKTVLNVGLSLAALLLITFPSQVFNRTLDQNYEEIRELLSRRFAGIRRRASPRLRMPGHTSKGAVALVMVGGALIGGFNDPTFGFNGHSLETYVGVLLTFLVGIATTALVGIGYRRARHLEGRPGPRAIPLGLAIAIGCVIVSRATNFQPGYLYGVVAGVAFSAELKTNEKGHEVALTSLATLCLAVVAWAIWTPVQHSVRVSHASPFGLIADTLLAALFVSGVINTVINLLPFESLAGKSLFGWRRGAWGAMFLASFFLLLEVLLVPAARSQRYSNAPFVVTAALFVAFATLSIGFNRYFARRHKTTPPDEVRGPATEPLAPPVLKVPVVAAVPPPVQAVVTPFVDHLRPEAPGDYDGA